MDKSKENIKILKRILQSEGLSEQDKCDLLQIKKDIEYGNIQYSNGLKDSQVHTFFIHYVEDISVWLSEPSDVIQERIKKGNFSELESTLILFNILIKVQKDKEYAEIY